MKWREHSHWRINPYFTGPVDVYYVARKGGVKYTVSASWDRMFARSGPFSWWSSDGEGHNVRHASLEDAKAYCERLAGVKVPHA